MKYLKLFEGFENIDIDKICNQYGIENYTINKDGSIDVNSDVYLRYKNLKKLPLKFNKVNGYFDCGDNQLTTLEGCPVEVNGNFFCNNNRLTSFEFSPRIIRGHFYCQNNNIKSFEYFPTSVKDFYCNNNPIFEVWGLFIDWTKIELLNDCDIFRGEDTDCPIIIMDRLNDFLNIINLNPVVKIYGYKNI